LSIIMEFAFTCHVEHQPASAERIPAPRNPDDGCEIWMPADARTRGIAAAADREREEMRALQERRKRQSSSLETSSRGPLRAR
jgi:hypothetical protein